MSNWSNMGNASNEKRNQRIMLLKQGYNHLRFVTLKQAAQYFGYSEQTITKWAKEGNVPLIIDNQHTVVPFNQDNKPTAMTSAENPADVLIMYMQLENSK